MGSNIYTLWHSFLLGRGLLSSTCFAHQASDTVSLLVMTLAVPLLFLVTIPQAVTSLFLAGGAVLIPVCWKHQHSLVLPLESCQPVASVFGLWRWWCLWLMIFQSHHNPSWLLAGVCILCHCSKFSQLRQSMPAKQLVVVPTGHQVYNLIHPFEQVFECCCDPCYHCSIVLLSLQHIFPLNGCTSNFFKITYQPVFIFSNVYCHIINRIIIQFVVCKMFGMYPTC